MVMLSLLEGRPNKTPTVSQLVVSLSPKLMEMANYLDLNETSATSAASNIKSVENATCTINKEIAWN